MKINLNALGVSLGIFSGLFVFLTTIANLWWGYAGAFSNLLLDVYSWGYGISYLGAFIGFVFGFIDGYISGVLIGFLYNRISNNSKKK